MDVNIPWTDRKVFLLWIWIRPHQIRHGSLVRNLSKSIDDLDLVYMMYTRAQAAMNAKDRVIDDHAQCEKVEHIGEVVPNGRRPVFPRAFEVESIRLSVNLSHSRMDHNVASDIRSVTARRLGFLEQCTTHSDIYRATIPSTFYRLESLFCILHHSPCDPRQGRHSLG